MPGHRANTKESFSLRLDPVLGSSPGGCSRQGQSGGDTRPWSSQLSSSSDPGHEAVGFSLCPAGLLPCFDRGMFFPSFVPSGVGTEQCCPARLFHPECLCLRAYWPWTELPKTTGQVKLPLKLWYQHCDGALTNPITNSKTLGLPWDTYKLRVISCLGDPRTLLAHRLNEWIQGPFSPNWPDNPTCGKGFHATKPPFSSQLAEMATFHLMEFC